jgi:hypothetical protein
MNTKESIFATRIRTALDESAGNLDINVQKRLANARDLALAHMKTEAVALKASATQAQLASAGGSGTGGPSFNWLQRFGLALPIIVLVLGLIGIHEWQQSQRASELADIDAAVLTDDLPLNAYLDKGFGQFLRKAGDE